MYEAIMSLEMAYLTTLLMSGQTNYNTTESNRHIIYHVAAFVVIVIVAVVPYEFDGVVQNDGGM